MAREDKLKALDAAISQIENPAWKEELEKLRPWRMEKCKDYLRLFK